jgi:hypothetical protein
VAGAVEVEGRLNRRVRTLLHVTETVFAPELEAVAHHSSSQFRFSVSYTRPARCQVLLRVSVMPVIVAVGESTENARTRVLPEVTLVVKACVTGDAPRTPLPLALCTGDASP